MAIEVLVHGGLGHISISELVQEGQCRNIQPSSFHEVKSDLTNKSRFKNTNWIMYIWN